MDFAIHEARVRLARQRNALLDDVRLVERDADGLLPFRLRNLPAEDDALAAVFVVRLEDELIAILGDEREEVDGIRRAGYASAALLDDARPRDVRADRLDL